MNWTLVRRTAGYFRYNTPHELGQGRATSVPRLLDQHADLLDARDRLQAPLEESAVDSNPKPEPTVYLSRRSATGLGLSGLLECCYFSSSCASPQAAKSPFLPILAGPLPPEPPSQPVTRTPLHKFESLLE